MMKSKLAHYVFFLIWTILSVLAFVRNIAIINWNETSMWIGAVVVILSTLAQFVHLQLTATTVFYGIFKNSIPVEKKSDGSHLTLLINYNLLAKCKQDVDDCLEAMYCTYMGNLNPNYTVVMVSATADEILKQYELKKRNEYRTKIYEKLFREGFVFLERNSNNKDECPSSGVWEKHFNKQHSNGMKFVDENKLKNFCETYANNFLVIHRRSRVLRKCGQYQDLILLSEGEDEAFTYCDKQLYGKFARRYNEPTFENSDDVCKILGRRFDYTLVLDSDNVVSSNIISELMNIAASYPDKGIIQPDIKLISRPTGTIFMHLQNCLSKVRFDIDQTLNSIFGTVRYCGKALLNNNIYRNNIIGTRDHLIEKVPINVLSHDTYETTILPTLFVKSVYICESECSSFISMYLQRQRWAVGEMINATYLYDWFGGLVRWTQEQYQGDKLNVTKVRTKTKLDFITMIVSGRIVRGMFVSPLGLCVFILCLTGVKFKYGLLSFLIRMLFFFLDCVLPITYKENLKKWDFVALICFTYYLGSIQSMMSCGRFIYVCASIISSKSVWVPHASIEKMLNSSNKTISSISFLGGHMIFGVCVFILEQCYSEATGYRSCLPIALILLPVFNLLTSYPLTFYTRKTKIE